MKSVAIVNGSYAVYKLLEKLKLWIISWPLAVKIIVPSVIVLAVIGLIILMILRRRKCLMTVYEIISIIVSVLSLIATISISLVVYHLGK